MTEQELSERVRARQERVENPPWWWAMAYALRLACAKLRARLRRGGPVVVPGESFLMRIAGEPHEEEAARKALLGK